MYTNSDASRGPFSALTLYLIQSARRQSTNLPVQLSATCAFDFPATVLTHTSTWHIIHYRIGVLSFRLIAPCYASLIANHLCKVIMSVGLRSQIQCHLTPNRSRMRVVPRSAILGSDNLLAGLPFGLSYLIGPGTPMLSS